MSSKKRKTQSCGLRVFLFHFL